MKYWEWWSGSAREHADRDRRRREGEETWGGGDIANTLKFSLMFEPFADLFWLSALFREEGWKYICRFVFVCFKLREQT